MKKSTIKFTGILSVFIGVVMLFFQIYSSVRVGFIRSDGIIINGEIVSERLLDFSGKQYYVYSIEFFYKELTYTIKTRYNDSKQRYRLGDKVSVLIDKDDPYQSIIDKQEETYLGPIIGYSISSLLLLTGLILIYLIKGRP